MSGIERLIDASVRCTLCGKPPGCDCWVECWCGWTYERGQTCRRDHDAYIASIMSCECGVPFGTRQDCGAQRKLTRPCRCHCHRRDMRAGRERHEASLAKTEPVTPPRLLNLLQATAPIEPDVAPTPRRRGSR